MGMRFRKSKNFGGIRINLSKSGIGYSVGCKGMRFTKKANGGNRSTFTLPGTGISYVKDSSSKRSSNQGGQIAGTANRKSGLSFGKIITLPFWLPFVAVYFVIKFGFIIAIELIKILAKFINKHLEEKENRK